MEGGIFGRIRIGLMGMGERLCYMRSVAESRGENRSEVTRVEVRVRLRVVHTD